MPEFPNFSSFDANTYPTVLEKLLSKSSHKIKELVKQSKPMSWENLMYPLECLDDELSKSFAVLSHLNAVQNTSELRAAYEACLPMLSAYHASYYHNQDLFEAIQSIDTQSLSHVQKKIISDTIRDFELSGIRLSSSKQKRLEAINTELSQLSNQFENHVLDATQAYELNIVDPARLKGLPEHALSAAQVKAQSNGQSGHSLGLDAPCYLAVMMYAEDRALRETLYEAYVTRASDTGPNGGQFDNTKIIEAILSLRAEKADLLEFSSFGALSLATKMAESPDAVFSFIEHLVENVGFQAKKDVSKLTQYAKEHLGFDCIMPWDIHFVSQKLKTDTLHFNDETLRPYFPLPKVLDGACDIIKSLYDITFLNVTHKVDTWHTDVQCFALMNSEKQPIAYIYMDLFARKNKRQGAWMDDAQGRHLKDDGTLQYPIAFLVCNFAQSKNHAYPILSHDEVTTFFHELGHCLHHTLTQINELSAAGIQGVEWDAVELPSQFFENFCWHEDALPSISSHVKTKAPLPHHLFHALIQSKQFMSGLHLIRQLEFAWFDFLLHDAYPANNASGWIDTALNAVRETTAVLPQASYNRFAHSFSHIFAGGYAAGYYSYLWAEVLSSDAFSKFEEEGILNPKTGQDFLQDILSIGSSKKAQEFYQDFRGRPPSNKAFLRHHGIDLSD